jgi:hypothetical protein
VEIGVEKPDGTNQAGALQVAESICTAAEIVPRGTIWQSAVGHQHSAKTNLVGSEWDDALY